MTNRIVSNAVMQLATHYVVDQVPFNIVTVNNDTGWEPAMPKELQGISILFNIINTDLEDTYFENGNIILAVGINDVVHTKTIGSHDIHSIGEYDKPFAITKQFKEELAEDTFIKGSLTFSKEVLIKFNPHLFNTSPKAI